MIIFKAWNNKDKNSELKEVISSILEGGEEMIKDKLLRKLLTKLYNCGVSQKKKESDKVDEQIFKLFANLRSQLTAEEKENEKLIAQRDCDEELIEKVSNILGCEEEWSNCHDHRVCIIENAKQITAQLAEKEKEIEHLKRVIAGFRGWKTKRKNIF